MLPLLLGTTAYGATGQLDPTFSGDGRALTAFPTRAEGTDVVSQPDGKVVVVGSSGGDFRLVRYGRRGALDRSFSGNGRQSTDFGRGDGANAAVLQPDGKVVVAGWRGRDMAVARYSPNGSLDRSFSDDGKQTIDVARSRDRATSVVLLPDGRIVMGGEAETDTDEGWTCSLLGLVRLMPDGSPDPTFSGDGKQASDCFAPNEPECCSSSPRAVTVQRDGKIVGLVQIGGYRSLEGTSVVRYHADGTPDRTFSRDGEKFYSGAGEDVLVRGDGKVIVGGDNGVSPAFGVPKLEVARFTPDGRADKTFSGDGRQQIAFGDNALGSGLTLQSDGKLVLAGRMSPSSSPYDEQFALARVNRNGSVDTTFSGDAKLLTDFPGTTAGAADVVTTPSGKIVAAGTADHKFAVARYR